MLLLQVYGDEAELREGMAVLAGDFGVEIGPEGLPVRVVRTDGPELRVYRDGQEAVIYYTRNIHFFRVFGLLIEALQDGTETFDIRETPQFTMNGRSAGK